MNQEAEPMLQAALKRGIRAVDHGDLRQGLAILSSIYNEESDGPADALSHYALCLAMVEKKFKPAIRLCERAISAQFYNSIHYANATRVLIAAGNRKRAVEFLEEGLKQLPKDPLLLEVRQRIGWRRGNIIPFLHRNHPLNIVLGKRRASARRKAGGDSAYAEQKKRRRGVAFWIAAVLAVVAYFVLVIGLFIWIVE